MFLRGKLCQKKIFKPCLLLAFCFSFLLSCVFSPFVSALEPNKYNAKYNVVNGTNEWHYNIAADSVFTVNYMYVYEWKIDAIYYSGNYANIRFETNIVNKNTQFGAFHNINLFKIKYCGSGGTSFDIKSSNVSAVKTQWRGPAPSSSVLETDNETLTIYADVVLSGLPANTTADLYCGVGLSNGWAFLGPKTGTSAQNGYPTYFEQSPTSITFTNSQDDAFQQQQLQSLNNISTSIDNLSVSIDNSSDYEKEKSDLEDKEEDVSSSLDGLSLSASPTANPFSDWFFNTSYGQCRNISVIPSWFGVPAFQRPWRVCSPIPSWFWSVYVYLSNIVLIALLIRLYYRLLKGGANG